MEPFPGDADGGCRASARGQIKISYRKKERNRKESTVSSWIINSNSDIHISFMDTAATKLNWVG